MKSTRLVEEKILWNKLRVSAEVASLLLGVAMAASFIRKCRVEQRSSLRIVVADPDTTGEERLPIRHKPSLLLSGQRPPTLPHHTQLHTNTIFPGKETLCLNRWYSRNPVRR
jgi:hypothetical protein